MEVVDLPLQGLKRITSKVFKDSRGYFVETYRKDVLSRSGIDVELVQDNHSHSVKNTVRGMHFQRTPGQAKLVRVSSGSIFDVVVDVRPQSPTFRRWYSETLEATSGSMLFIPVGFAHGFCVTSATADVQYKTSSVYDPAAEDGFAFDDPAIGIRWPVERERALLSGRDLNAEGFSHLRWKD